MSGLRALGLAPRGMLCALLLCLTIVANRPTGLSAETVMSEPEATVQALDDALLTAMRDADSLGYQGRYDLLAPVLNDIFDYAFMARVTVGRHWRSLDESQKALLTDVFGRLSAATFASRFSGFSGESFEVGGQEERPRDTLLVFNALIKSDGTKVPIDILMREQDGDWRAIDIYLDGTYSELAIKRSEYTSVIEREGFDALIAAMEAQVAQQSRAAQN